MKEKLKTLGKLSISYKNEKVVNQKMLHQSKLLLEMYRRVVWGVEHSLYDLEVTAEEFGSRRIQQLIDFLAFDFEREIDEDKIENHLNSIAATQDLMESLDLTRSTFYRYKRYATHLLGVILWGYVLPEFSETSSGLLKCAEDVECQYDAKH